MLTLFCFWLLLLKQNQSGWLYTTQNCRQHYHMSNDLQQVSAQSCFVEALPFWFPCPHFQTYCGLVENRSCYAAGDTCGIAQGHWHHWQKTVNVLAVIMRSYKIYAHWSWFVIAWILRMNALLELIPEEHTMISTSWQVNLDRNRRYAVLQGCGFTIFSPFRTSFRAVITFRRSGVFSLIAATNTKKKSHK